jgi:hypothetical protein
MAMLQSDCFGQDAVVGELSLEGRTRVPLKGTNSTNEVSQFGHKIAPAATLPSNANRFKSQVLATTYTNSGIFPYDGNDVLRLTVQSKMP